MLAIRMQRTGRKGQAMFRVVVQDSRQTPSSGRVVAQLGSYNPHTKEAALDTKKIEFYLSNGAQPSDRAARLIQKEGVKLPDWVRLSEESKRSVRNPEKLRKNRPAEEAAPEAATEEKPAETAETTEEAPVEATSEAPAEEAAPEAEASSEDAKTE